MHFIIFTSAVYVKKKSLLFNNKNKNNYQIYFKIFFSKERLHTKFKGMTLL